MVYTYTYISTPGIYTYTLQTSVHCVCSPCQLHVYLDIKVYSCPADTHKQRFWFMRSRRAANTTKRRGSLPGVFYLSFTRVHEDIHTHINVGGVSITLFFSLALSQNENVARTPQQLYVVRMRLTRNVQSVRANFTQNYPFARRAGNFIYFFFLTSPICIKKFRLLTSRRRVPGSPIKLTFNREYTQKFHARHYSLITELKDIFFQTLQTEYSATRFLCSSLQYLRYATQFNYWRVYKLEKRREKYYITFRNLHFSLTRY